MYTTTMTVLQPEAHITVKKALRKSQLLFKGQNNV